MKTKLFTVLSILTVLVVLAGCSSSDNTEKNAEKAEEPAKTETIKIATKPMTEQFILSELLKALIEDNTDLTVEITKGIGGGTSNIHPAMVKGEFDLYPEYTGTSWLTVLKKTDIPDSDTIYAELQKEYNEQFDMSWLGLYGFDNTYGVIVNKDIVNQYNLTKISDLEKVAPELVFGANYDYFEREDGFNALAKTYNLKFKKTVDMDIGLRFQALDNGETDVTTLYTTDGQLSITEHKVLEDDKHFFQNYYAGTIIRNDTLNKYPELKVAIAKLDNQISEAEMAKMNYEVEGNGKDEADVAHDFLVSKGLIQ